MVIAEFMSRVMRKATRFFFVFVFFFLFFFFSFFFFFSSSIAHCLHIDLRFYHLIIIIRLLVHCTNLPSSPSSLLLLPPPLLPLLLLLLLFSSSSSSSSSSYSSINIVLKSSMYMYAQIYSNSIKNLSLFHRLGKG